MEKYFKDRNLIVRRELSDSIQVVGVDCPKMCRYIPVTDCAECKHLTQMLPNDSRILCDYAYWFKNIKDKP